MTHFGHFDTPGNSVLGPAGMACITSPSLRRALCVRTLSLLAFSVLDQSFFFLDGYSWGVFRWGKGLDALALGRSKKELGWLLNSLPFLVSFHSKKVLLTLCSLLECDAHAVILTLTGLDSTFSFYIPSSAYRSLAHPQES